MSAILLSNQVRWGGMGVEIVREARGRGHLSKIEGKIPKPKIFRFRNV